LPALTIGHEQGCALYTLAISYNFSGQPGRSVPLLRRAKRIARHLRDARNTNVYFSTLGDALYKIGALREAVCAFRQGLVLNRDSENEFQEGVTLEALGRALGLTGAHGLACVTLGRSRHLYIERSNRQGEGLVGANLAELALWLGDCAKAATWAERAWELAAVNRLEQDFIRAALLQDRVALGAGEFSRADERLHYALTRTRAVNVVEFELPALIAIAELELKRGDPAKARASLDDLWEVVERGPYPLHQADALNVLADIAFAEGDKRAAIAAATEAFNATWRDGPLYAYHWGLEKAKAHLAALGAPEPVLPPFDESKFEPMPEVEINPKDEYWVDPDELD
jgi:tetratricopeptide (TPR) repeat protein